MFLFLSIEAVMFLFLDASSHLYRPLYLSVRLSVCLSVRPSGRSIKIALIVPNCTLVEFVHDVIGFIDQSGALKLIDTVKELQVKGERASNEEWNEYNCPLLKNRPLL